MNGRTEIAGEKQTFELCKKKKKKDCRGKKTEHMFFPQLGSFWLLR